MANIGDDETLVPEMKNRRARSKRVTIRRRHPTSDVPSAPAAASYARRASPATLVIFLMTAGSLTTQPSSSLEVDLLALVARVLK